MNSARVTAACVLVLALGIASCQPRPGALTAGEREFLSLTGDKQIAALREGTPHERVAKYLLAVKYEHHAGPVYDDALARSGMSVVPDLMDALEREPLLHVKTQLLGVLVMMNERYAPVGRDSLIVGRAAAVVATIANDDYRREMTALMGRLKEPEVVGP